MEKLSGVQIAKISQLYSLDTKETPISVQGERHDEYLKFIQDISVVLRRNHTLTRKEIFSNRQMFNGSTFFVSRDGYYDDHRQVITDLVNEFNEFAKLVERLNAQTNKSYVQRYNLQLCEIVLTDMLAFVEGIVYEP